MNRQPEVHRLKTLQPFFGEVKERKKNFELRLNDRDYQASLNLKKYGEMLYQNNL